MRRSGLLSLSTGLAVLMASAQPAWASSHREAPNITKMPKVDNTDVYAFRSYEPGRAGFVTLIANFQPFQDPGGGPNYFTMDPDAVYEIMVDNNGDAREDITFQFRFTNTLRNGTGKTITAGGKTLPIPLRHLGAVTDQDDPDLGEVENYTVTVVQGDRRSGSAQQISSGGRLSFMKPLDNIGTKTTPSYPAYAQQFVYAVGLPNCSQTGKVFAGQRAEAFAVNLGPTFDLVNYVPIEGEGFPGGIRQSDGNQGLIGKYNTSSLALEIPISCLTGTGNGVIGVWSSASLPQSRMLKSDPTFSAPDVQGGALTQVSRLGMPLVNELVIGTPDKNLFNAVKPTADAALADYVTNPTFPEILNVLFRDPVNATLGTGFSTIAPRNFPRNDLVATFLTGIASLNQMSTVTASEMLRLNTAVNPTPRGSQNPLGVIEDDLAGFPNGRRPGDDVVDIVLRVAMGRLCHPIPINGVQTQLGLCQPGDAPTGKVAYTDGAPVNSTYVQNAFPYLQNPLRGAPRPPQ